MASKMNFPNNQINRLNLSSFINSMGGRFFTVTFKKQDGTMRRMTAKIRRVQAKSDRPYTKNMRDNTCMTVWDSAKMGYRKINLCTAVEVVADGKTLEVV